MNLKQRIIDNIEHIYMLGTIPLTMYEKEVLDYARRDIRPATHDDVDMIIKHMSWSRVKELVYHN